MIDSITEYQFIDGFKQQVLEKKFTYEGLQSLYNYFLEVEEETGIEIEYDPIGIGSDFSEYKNLDDIIKDYSRYLEKKEGEGVEEATEEEKFNIIAKHTVILKIKNGYIIQKF